MISMALLTGSTKTKPSTPLIRLRLLIRRIGIGA